MLTVNKSTINKADRGKRLPRISTLTTQRLMRAERSGGHTRRTTVVVVTRVSSCHTHGTGYASHTTRHLLYHLMLEVTALAVRQRWEGGREMD